MDPVLVPELKFCISFNFRNFFFAQRQSFLVWPLYCTPFLWLASCCEETFFLISRLWKIKSLLLLCVSVDCISQQRSEHS